MWALACAVAGCGDGGSEASRLSVVVTQEASAAAPFTTALGYTVQLTECRMVIADLTFTSGGAQHASAPWWSLFVGTAHAHPGHGADGTVIGELPGRFVLDCLEGAAQLGEGSFLPGTYDGADFRFALGEASDGLSEGDPLLGHTAIIAGSACLDEGCWTFEAAVTQDADRVLEGAPLSLTLPDASVSHLGLAFTPEDPFEGQTIFDTQDFSALGEPGAHLVFAEGDAYNRLLRQLQRHDFYLVNTHTGETR